jgi:hypothetical protein
MTGPSVNFKKVQRKGMKGNGVVASVTLHEGQSISFILRQDLDNHVSANITTAILDSQQHDTQQFWYNWLSKSLYKGAWREVVSRSLMILKMLTYEPTGAIVAAPTFSIPEAIGGIRSVNATRTVRAILTGRRNWDYRFSYVFFKHSALGLYITGLAVARFLELTVQSLSSSNRDLKTDMLTLHVQLGSRFKFHNIYLIAELVRLELSVNA